MCLHPLFFIFTSRLNINCLMLSFSLLIFKIQKELGYQITWTLINFKSNLVLVVTFFYFIFNTFIRSR